MELVLAFSALYEIIEWGVAARVDPAAGLAFLGAQGDVWDAQKDMLLAGMGATLAMALVALVHWRMNPGFGRELLDSLKAGGGDRPLGESALEDMLRRSKDDP
jgi:putative membrane protein